MKTGHTFSGNLFQWRRGFRASQACAIGTALVLGLFSISSASWARAIDDSRTEVRYPLMKKPTAPQFSNGRFNIQGSLGIGSQYVTDEFNEGGAAAFGGSTRLNYKFLDSLHLNAEAFMVFSSERFQSQFDSDDFAGGLFARRFDLVFKPIQYFQVGVGGINQKEFINAPLLVSNRAFPGTYEQINIGNTDNGIQFRAGQYIPTSRSFDSDRQEKEEFPFLSTLGVKANLTPNKHITFSPFAMQFRYQNMPSVVAFRSRVRGNDTTGETSADSQFVYAFEGYVAGGSVKISPVDTFSMIFEYQAIENTQAIETTNSGAIGSVRAEWQVGETVFKPLGGAYYNEPNTAPGLYNQGDFGHNNREGYFYGMDVDFNQYNFRVRSKIVQANAINDTDFNFQTDQTYVAIFLETLYVEF